MSLTGMSVHCKWDLSLKVITTGINNFKECQIFLALSYWQFRTTLAPFLNKHVKISTFWTVTRTPGKSFCCGSVMICIILIMTDYIIYLGINKHNVGLLFKVNECASFCLYHRRELIGFIVWLVCLPFLSWCMFHFIWPLLHLQHSHPTLIINSYIYFLYCWLLDDPCPTTIVLIFDHRQMVERSAPEVRVGGGVCMFRWRAGSLLRERLKVSCWDTNYLCNLIILMAIAILVDLVWASLGHWDCYHGYFGCVFEGSQTVNFDEMMNTFVNSVSLLCV